jgi:hypothetical protein
MGECPTDSPAGLRGKKPVYPGPSKDKFLPLRSLDAEDSLSGFVSVDQNAIAGGNSGIGQHLEFHNSI